MKINFTNLSCEKSEKKFTFKFGLSYFFSILPIGIPDLKIPPAPEVKTIFSFSMRPCSLIY